MGGEGEGGVVGGDGILGEGAAGRHHLVEGGDALAHGEEGLRVDAKGDDFAGNVWTRRQMTQGSNRIENRDKTVPSPEFVPLACSL